MFFVLTKKKNKTMTTIAKKTEEIQALAADSLIRAKHLAEEIIDTCENLLNKYNQQDVQKLNSNAHQIFLCTHKFKIYKKLVCNHEEIRY